MNGRREPTTVYETESGLDDWPEPDGESDASAVAEYMADMIGQLEDIARRSQLDLLVYLLSMAKSEAQVHARTQAATTAKSA